MVAAAFQEENFSVTLRFFQILSERRAVASSQIYCRRCLLSHVRWEESLSALTLNVGFSKPVLFLHSFIPKTNSVEPRVCLYSESSLLLPLVASNPIRTSWLKLQEQFIFQALIDSKRDYNRCMISRIFPDVSGSIVCRRPTTALCTSTRIPRQLPMLYSATNLRLAVSTVSFTYYL